MPTHVPHASHPLVGAHPRCMQYGYTALIFAAMEGQLDVVRLLVDRGAGINAQTKVRLIMTCVSQWVVVRGCRGKDLCCIY